MNNLYFGLDLNLAEMRYGTEAAMDIAFARRIALGMDTDPLGIDYYRFEPTITKLCKDRDGSCVERSKLAEIIAYGDANVFLACPNPSLAGGAIREIADQEQKKYFFDFVEETHCTTFTGITEPQHGSDVASLETQLAKIDVNTYQITGEKCFITHGFDGKIGVVVARTGSGPLGIQSVMLKEEDLKRGEEEGTLQREMLPIVGLRGTCLSRIVFHNFIIPAENLLGKHLRVSQRGMFSLIKIFNRMRPCVAAFSLGQAQGMLDYVATAISHLTWSQRCLLRSLNAELSYARSNLYASAKIIDENPLDSASVSLVKAQVTRLTERVCSRLLNQIGAVALCAHPLLLKWSRDIYAFEYMEGTSDMQKRNVSQKYLARTLVGMNQK